MSRPSVLLVVEREARVYRRLWQGSVFSAFVLPLLFLGAIGVGLGGLVNQHQAGGVGGVSYLHFVTPGLLAGTAMQVAAGQSLWGPTAGLKWVRFFHGIVTTPLTPPDVHAGYVLWAGLRTGLQAAIFLVVAGALGGVASWWGLLAIVFAVLIAAAFAAVLMAFSATQQTDLTFPVIMRLGIMPLFLFSGTFFPVSQLPRWLRPWSRLSPLWHGVELCRHATVGRLSWGSDLGHVAFLAAMLAAGLWWGARTFTKALAR
jgi:lipooligosaccharide transport system permease protein